MLVPCRAEGAIDLIDSLIDLIDLEAPWRPIPPSARSCRATSSPCRPTRPCLPAADVLAEHGIGAAPVVEDGRIVGLLRDEDLIVSEAKLHVPTVIEFLGADIVWPASERRWEKELKKARCRHRPRRDDDGVPAGRAHRHRRAGRDRDARREREPRAGRRRRPRRRASWRAATSSGTSRTPRDTLARPPMTERRGGSRAVWSEVDLDAVRANVRALCAHVAPAELLAVVKANGYGHGAAPVARAALDAGAAWLGVARVEEGVQLRGHGIDAPILLLSEPPVSAAEAVVTHSITPVVYTEPGVDSLAKAVAAFGGRDRLSVHLKVDTGMHRVGCDPDEALALVERIDAEPRAHLGGDLHAPRGRRRPDRPVHRRPARAVRRGARRAARRAGSTRASCTPRTRRRRWRARPRATTSSAWASPRTASHRRRPSARWSRCDPRSRCTPRVMMVRELAAGERLSYGLRYELPHASRIATVSAGYADGVPRNLGLVGGEVLVGGRRSPDRRRGHDGPADGRHRRHRGRGRRRGRAHRHARATREVTATEWAERLGTIAYEVVTGIGARVPRTYR